MPLGERWFQIYLVLLANRVRLAGHSELGYDADAALATDSAINEYLERFPNEKRGEDGG